MPASPPPTRSVAVIGGGVVGLCVALALQEREFAVTLIDRRDALPPPSWGNAGRLAVEQNEPLASAATLRSLPGSLFFRGGPVAFPPSAIDRWMPFGMRLVAASGAARFHRGKQALSALLSQAIPAWRRRLHASGSSELLVETGHYSIWENADTFLRGREAWHRNSGAATPMEVDPSETARLRALIGAPISGMMKFTGTASIADPTVLLSTLADSFMSAGGHLEQGHATVADALRVASRVVVAAGVDSGALLAPMGHRVPIIAERGYHIQQADPAWPEDIAPIYFEDRTLVLTRFRSALRMTSFVEFTSKDAPPDARKWARLRQHARELGLPFGDDTTQWLGSRPTLPDYLPAIGRSTRNPDVFYAFGHQHLGLTLAAITAETTAAMLDGETTSVDTGPFSIDRFGR
jgi:glycine/D-amino acid oxidase-like deaminating enzyme